MANKKPAKPTSKKDAAVEPLIVRRWLAASRERVFQAFAQQSQMDRWMCRDAASHVIRYEKFDFREGGECVLAISIGREQRFMQYLRYTKIVPPSQIVWTWEWEHLDRSGKLLEELRNSVVTIDLAEARGGTELTLTHEFLPDPKSFADHQRGWNGCIDELEKLLATSPGSGEARR